MSTGENELEPPVRSDDATSDATATATETPAGPESEAEAKPKLDLEVEISDVGPCKKHIKVAIARTDIDRQFADSLKTMSREAFVPGFRPGHAPRRIVEKRYKKEVAGQVKSTLLTAALEQLDEDYKIEPISAPKLDIDAITLPDEGPLRFEIEVEVRPEFDLPDYQGLSVQRPTRVISEADVDAAVVTFREQYAQLVPKLEGNAELGDFVTADITFAHEGHVHSEVKETQFRLQPELRFQDGVVPNLGAALVGAQTGETRVAEAQIGSSSPDPHLRGAIMQARFLIQDLKQYRLPEIDTPFLNSFGFEHIDDLRAGLRAMLERRVRTQTFQAIRGQIMDQLMARVAIDLPADLVARQEASTIRRLVDELREGGLGDTQIRAREAEIRANAHDATLRTLKENFIIGKIAQAEALKVEEADVDAEILAIAERRDENPRRVRARIEKDHQAEALYHQILERKVLVRILDSVTFEEVTQAEETEVETLDQSVTTAGDADAEAEPESGPALEASAADAGPATEPADATDETSSAG